MTMARSVEENLRSMQYTTGTMFSRENVSKNRKIGERVTQGYSADGDSG